MSVHTALKEFLRFVLPFMTMTVLKNIGQFTVQNYLDSDWPFASHMILAYAFWTEDYRSYAVSSVHMISGHMMPICFMTGDAEFYHSLKRVLTRIVHYELIYQFSTYWEVDGEFGHAERLVVVTGSHNTKKVEQTGNQQGDKQTTRKPMKDAQHHMPLGSCRYNSDERHSTLTKVEKIPRLTMPSAVQNVGQQQLRCIPGGNAKRHWEGSLAVCCEAK